MHAPPLFSNCVDVMKLLAPLYLPPPPPFTAAGAKSLCHGVDVCLWNRL